MRKAISVTLTRENLLWLKGQAGRTTKGSVSEVLDALVAEARLGGHALPDAIRSVVGSAVIPEEDADLAGADAYIRELFATSARQPLLVREEAPGKGRPKRG